FGLPLIPVWLQVGVLPAPPRFAFGFAWRSHARRRRSMPGVARRAKTGCAVREAREGCHAEARRAKAGARPRVTARLCDTRSERAATLPGAKTNSTHRRTS